MTRDVAEPLSWMTQFARERGLRYEAEPDERWLRVWEPYATLRSPIRYEHVLSSTGAIGSLTLARFVVPSPSSSGPSGGTPKPPREASAWIAITQDVRLSARAAATSDRAGVFGEGLDLVTMPRRRTGDVHFDAAFATFAQSDEDVAGAVGPSVRKLVMGWRAPLHFEIRAGGFVLAPVALAADLQSLTWLVTAVELFGAKAAKPAPG
jgi:hypothetical protein